MAPARAVAPPRVVTLVLCRRDGEVVGALPPFEVAVPWWPEAAAVVEGARAHHGVDVVLLRLLSADASMAVRGGPVTYLAEVGDADVPRCEPWHGDPNGPEPLRAPWARPGGPAADLAWADDALERAGTPRTGVAQQVRTWNLSSLWRLPTTTGAAWLKVVPAFFAHEGALLSLLDPAPVPRVVDRDGGRALLHEVPGEDQYDAPVDVSVRMVDLLVALQSAWAGRTTDLLATGAPDWRGGALTRTLPDVVARDAGALGGDVVARLDAVLDGLAARLEAVAACGLPDTLVHGDFHRGNVRAAGDDLVLLDWGDAGVGHPMLDQAAFLDGLPEGDRGPVVATWERRWREEVPGSDPGRAAALLAPVAALRQASTYRHFLDRIEPDERVYHATDPATWLRRAAATPR